MKSAAAFRFPKLVSVEAALGDFDVLAAATTLFLVPGLRPRFLPGFLSAGPRSAWLTNAGYTLWPCAVNSLMISEAFKVGLFAAKSLTI